MRCSSQVQSLWNFLGLKFNLILNLNENKLIQFTAQIIELGNLKDKLIVYFRIQVTISTIYSLIDLISVQTSVISGACFSIRSDIALN